MPKLLIFLHIIILITYITAPEDPLQYPEPAGGWEKGDCQSTQIQSPINIPSLYDDNLVVDDHSHAQINSLSYSVINSGSVNYDGGHKWTTSTLDIGNLLITLNGTSFEYKLNSIHFHLNSEHRFQNKQYPMEMHIVHKNLNTSDTDNENLVIGVLFDYENNVENDFLNNMKLSTGETIQNANIKELISEDEPFYYYKGGLTTVPCTENVNWIVFKEVRNISFSQFSTFSDWVSNTNKQYFGTGYGNARGPKDLNGRKVYLENYDDVNIKVKSGAETRFMSKMAFILPLIMFLL